MSQQKTHTKCHINETAPEIEKENKIRHCILNS